MDPEDTKHFARQLIAIREEERELTITLAKVSAGLKLGAGGGEEVRG